ncbi:MAG TPA: type II toxin-antitoxin system RelE/ParE family toxin [Anaeromyxobacteraceae bacterium]|nr:type II toxin-antitoxin system RelE/ParE family toxin [Anaeromyxobacteraceae bacterium]
MAWRIELTGTAAKQLAKLDRGDARRITSFLRERLAPLDDPRAAGKALQGPLGTLWRYRVGDFRLLATIDDDVLRVLVVRIGHRREVYRGQ